jgi:hypothetical protein
MNELVVSEFSFRSIEGRPARCTGRKISGCFVRDRLQMAPEF